eukprot:SAG31_NODE_3651_length_4025_cov_3.433520_7_plen_96_part_00
MGACNLWPQAAALRAWQSIMGLCRDIDAMVLSICCLGAVGLGGAAIFVLGFLGANDRSEYAMGQASHLAHPSSAALLTVEYLSTPVLRSAVFPRS